MSKSKFWQQAQLAVVNEEKSRHHFQAILGVQHINLRHRTPAYKFCVALLPPSKGALS